MRIEAVETGVPDMFERTGDIHKRSFDVEKGNPRGYESKIVVKRGRTGKPDP